jgi:uncharacterized protein with PQ loop repeat
LDGREEIRLLLGVGCVCFATMQHLVASTISCGLLFLLYSILIKNMKVIYKKKSLQFAIKVNWYFFIIDVLIDQTSK